MQWSKETAAAVLAKCFPGLDLGCLTWFGEGWDNTIWEVNGTLFRLPKRRSGNAQAAKEIALLQYLVDAGPPVPLPMHVHHATARLPYTIYAYSKIPGQALDDAGEWPEALHANMGRVLARLHDLDTSTIPHAVRAYSPRQWRARYRHLFGTVRQVVAPHLSQAASSRLMSVFEQYLSDDANLEFSPALIHGDLSTEHVLRFGDRIAGIIDFGDARIGDPALDFAGMSPFQASRTHGYYMRATHCHAADHRMLERAAFYKHISPCYAIIHPGLAGEAELSRAVARLEESGSAPPE